MSQRIHFWYQILLKMMISWENGKKKNTFLVKNFFCDKRYPTWCSLNRPFRLTWIIIRPSILLPFLKILQSSFYFANFHLWLISNNFFFFFFFFFVKDVFLRQIKLQCVQTSIVLHWPTSANASVLRDYPRCAHKYLQCLKLLWKISIGRRWLMHNEVWKHHYSTAMQLYKQQFRRVLCLLEGSTLKTRK